MMRRSKRDKPDPLIRSFLASNVTTLRDKRYNGHRSVTARNRALAAEADTTLSQIQRVISQELGTSVDLIARLARALQVRPQDLLTPYFAMQSSDDGDDPKQKKPERATGTRRGLAALKVI